ncbi:MAG: hypothetical protein HY690_03390 [Chloroflexi bacterium]|nr:hypothetical protein [Chloroflexota bacterium]
MTLQTERLALALGESAQVIAAVRNQSPYVDQFELQVEGIDASWYTVKTERASLFPGDEGPLELEINLPLDRSIEAGARTVRLRVTSAHDPQHITAVEFPLDVLPVGGLEMTLSPKVVNTSGTARFRIILTNLGNADRLVDLTATDPDEVLVTNLELDRLNVAPLETEEVALRVRPFRPALIAPPVRYAFKVSAFPSDVELAEPLATAEGALVYRAPFTWLAVLAPRVVSLVRLAAILAIVAALVVWVAGTPALPSPVIDTRPTRTPAVLGAVMAALAAYAPTEEAEAAAGEPAAGSGAAAGGSGAAAGGRATGGAARVGIAIGGPGVPRPVGAEAAGEEPPRIAVFDLSIPPNPKPGELEVTWEVEGATEVTVADNPQPPSGSLRLENAQGGELELVARNAAGEERRSIGIVILRSPEVVDFRVSPESVQPRQPAMLTWQLRRAERAVLLGPGLHPQGQAVNPSAGQLEVRPEQEATFLLVAENALGRVERRVIVRVPGAGGTPGTTPAATSTPAPASTPTPAPTVPAGTPAPASALAIPTPASEPPAIEYFGLAASLDDPVQSLPLQWQVSGANEIRLERGDPPTGGPRPYQALESTEYRLTASNAWDSVSRFFTVYVLRPPSIDVFESDRTPIRPGEGVRLSWQVSGAERVFLDGQPLQSVSAGFTHTIPATTREYELRAENAIGTITRRVLVVVNPGGRLGAQTVASPAPPATATPTPRPGG